MHDFANVCQETGQKDDNWDPLADKLIYKWKSPAKELSYSTSMDQKYMDVQRVSKRLSEGAGGIVPFTDV